ncbi:MAG: hypothetical protein WCJ30_03540 [Deltaproteobacteria bacterium]
MQVRTQLAVVAVIAAGWGAGNYAVVRPVVDHSEAASRASLAQLEAMVARDRDNVVAARALAERYLALHMPQLAVDTMARMTAGVQSDGRVVLNVARGYEQLGDVQTASARLNGALNRCQTVPEDLAAGAGCDVRTQTEIAIESTAVDRMISWHVSPVSDPDRAALAHDLAIRPISMARIGN